MGIGEVIAIFWIKKHATRTQRVKELAMKNVHLLLQFSLIFRFHLIKKERKGKRGCLLHSKINFKKCIFEFQQIYSCRYHTISRLGVKDWRKYCLTTAYCDWARFAKIEVDVGRTRVYKLPNFTVPTLGPLLATKNFMQGVYITQEGALEWW